MSATDTTKLRRLGRLPIGSAADISAAPQRWLWPGRIPLGKLTILEGHGGTGKTLVAVDLAARLSQGTDYPDGARLTDGQADTLILDYENGAREIKLRLLAAGANTGRIAVLNLGQDYSSKHPPEAFAAMSRLSQQDNVDWLAEEISANYPNVRLVIFDGIISALGVADSNDEVKVRNALKPLGIWASRTGITLLGIKHFRKNTGNGRDAGAGSHAWRSVARCLIQVWEVAGQHYLAWQKMNDGKLPPTLTFAIPDPPAGDAPRLSWTGVSAHGAEALGGMAANADDPKSRPNTLRERMDDAFAMLFPEGAEPQRCEALIEQADWLGLTEKQLRYRLPQWVQEGRLTEMPTGQRNGKFYARAVVTV